MEANTRHPQTEGERNPTSLRPTRHTKSASMPNLALHRAAKSQIRGGVGGEGRAQPWPQSLRTTEKLDSHHRTIDNSWHCGSCCCRWEYCTPARPCFISADGLMPLLCNPACNQPNLLNPKPTQQICRTASPGEQSRNCTQGSPFASSPAGYESSA